VRVDACDDKAVFSGLRDDLIQAGARALSVRSVSLAKWRALLQLLPDAPCTLITCGLDEHLKTVSASRSTCNAAIVSSSRSISPRDFSTLMDSASFLWMIVFLNGGQSIGFSGTR
jgi:hypothetical protein